MHKDLPPGLFDLKDRSLRYAAGFCFVAGFILSIIVRVVFVLANEHFSPINPGSGQ